MPTYSTRLSIPIPTLTEAADAPAVITAVAAVLDAAGLWGQGLIANIPAASGITGRFYWATDESKLYINNGSAWFSIGPNVIGPDSVTAAMIAAAAVTASELADDSVDTAAIQALAVTNAKLAASAVDGTKVAASLKPSGGAGGSTEALRALGVVAGTALAGDSFAATPVAVGTSASRTTGQTYTVAAPAAGTYIIEWGCAGISGSSGGNSGTIATNKTGAVTSGFTNPAGAGGPAVVPGIALTNGEVVTATVSANPGFAATNCWIKLTRTA